MADLDGREVKNLIKQWLCAREGHDMIMYDITDGVAYIVCGFCGKEMKASI